MNPKDAFSIYNLPQNEELSSLINETITSLRSENELLRPVDATGSSGAMLDIHSFTDKPHSVVLIPDLHARLDFFNEIMNFSFPFNGESEASLTVAQALEQKKVFVICVGDGLHSEKRGQMRWIQAQEHWLNGSSVNDFLCAEMEEGLGLMTAVMEAKLKYGDYFHFLKGNHENILNATICGNLPFRKFASEGEMVKDFMLELYGSEVTHAYANFEHNLPLFVRGTNFLVSHAEPLRAFSMQELINAYLDESTILGLTWTNTDEAEENSVHLMLKNLLPDVCDAVYFAGHRTFLGTHRALRDGKFIQIHNPNEHFISIVDSKKGFNPLEDIYDTRTGKKAESFI